MSEILFVVLSISGALLIVFVPLAIYGCSQAKVEIVEDLEACESTPLKRNTDLADEEDSDAYDPNTVINGLLLHGIVLHTTKGPKKVIMSLLGQQLRWSSSSTGKKYMIDVSDVKYVESGKKTHNFRKKASSTALEQHCFSLVCQATTVDLEAASESDRDMLVDNFHHVIERLIADRKESDV